MSNTHFLAILSVFQLVVYSCSKEELQHDNTKNIASEEEACTKDSIQEKNTICFNFSSVGNKWIYEKLRTENYGSDTVSVDTIISEIISVSNNITKFSNQWNGYTNFQIGSFIGGIIAFSPLKIDTIVKCDSKPGDSLPSSRAGFHYTPTYTIKRIDAQFVLNGETLDCYNVHYYDGESSSDFYITKEYGIVKSRFTSCPGGVNCYSIIHRLIKADLR